MFVWCVRLKLYIDIIHGWFFNGEDMQGKVIRRKVYLYVYIIELFIVYIFLML